MLKPIDSKIKIKLLKKKGGKSDIQINIIYALLLWFVLTPFQPEKEDKAGKEIINKLEKCGVIIHDYQIIADEIPLIKESTEPC